MKKNKKKIEYQAILRYTITYDKLSWWIDISFYLKEHMSTELKMRTVEYHIVNTLGEWVSIYFNCLTKEDANEIERLIVEAQNFLESAKI